MKHTHIKFISIEKETELVTFLWDLNIKVQDESLTSIHLHTVRIDDKLWSISVSVSLLNSCCFSALKGSMQTHLVVATAPYINPDAQHCSNQTSHCFATTASPCFPQIINMRCVSSAILRSQSRLWAWTVVERLVLGAIDATQHPAWRFTPPDREDNSVQCSQRRCEQLFLHHNHIMLLNVPLLQVYSVPHAYQSLAERDQWAQHWPSCS